MAVNTFGWKRREIVVLPQDHKATLTDTHFCSTQQLQDQSQIGMYLSSGLSHSVVTLGTHAQRGLL